MAADNKLETLAEEVKLMKGELKQSLSSVRDYLLNMELPASEFAAILAALGNDNNGIQKLQIDGALSNLAGGAGGDGESEGTGDDLQDDDIGGGLDDDIESPGEDEDLFDMEPSEDEAVTESPEDSITDAGEELLPDDAALAQEEGGLGEDAIVDGEDTGLGQDTMLDDDLEDVPEDSLVDQADETLPDDAMFDQPEDVDAEEISDEEAEDDFTPSSRLPEEEEQMEYDRNAAEINRSVPKVNMLANLIHWVARAKQEIGAENIPAFLEVYGISGYLSVELKELIVQLAEIASENLAEASSAEIWSQAMLSLHGILTGGEAPVHPITPSQLGAESEIEPVDEEVIEVGKSAEKPVKLKLVFPNGDGSSKEFCINLAPEAESEGAAIELEN